MSATASLRRAAETTRPSPPVAADAAVCEIRLVHARADFDALEAEWTALFARAGRPDQLFQRFNWLWHWANHFLREGLSLCLVTGWSCGRLVMVWPLVRSRHFGLDRLAWMGEPVSQYGDVLIEPGPLAEAQLAAGWAAVTRLGADVAVLRKMRRSTVAAPLLANVGRSTASAFAPYVDFAAARRFEDVQNRFSAKARSSRRRLLRRLEELGPVGMRQEASPAEAGVLVRQAFTLKKQALDRRGRYSPALDDPAMEAFFQAVMVDSARPVGALFDVVSCGGAVVGIALSFSCKGECFGHILAHDVAFNRQGVGVILAEQTFRAAMARGLTRFDMLAPDDAFKIQWASGLVPVDDWAVPLTLRGRAYVTLWLGRLRPALKRCAERAPQQLGSALWGLVRRLKRMRPASPIRGSAL